jgi:hypothetical protein
MGSHEKSEIKSVDAVIKKMRLERDSFLFHEYFKIHQILLIDEIQSLIFWKIAFVEFQFSDV